MSKYKYYFRKPKSEIAKDILKGLLIAGALCMAGNSPYIARGFIKSFNKWANNKNKKRFYDTFYRLKKEGLVKISKVNHQIYISLTKEGKKKAGWMQIDELKIKKPKKWDGKWRMVMFDISQLKIIYRNVFRGKLKELGFQPLQKSIWICPYNCKDEINLLKDFLGMTNNEIRLVIAEDIGEEEELTKKFKI
ncbi:MAG: hypothetical protein Q8N69_00635 [bacterium]|nr:hypothetical protein [bacterium]